MIVFLNVCLHTEKCEEEKGSLRAHLVWGRGRWAGKEVWLGGRRVQKPGKGRIGGGLPDQGPGRSELPGG